MERRRQRFPLDGKGWLDLFCLSFPLPVSANQISSLPCQHALLVEQSKLICRRATCYFLLSSHPRSPKSHTIPFPSCLSVEMFWHRWRKTTQTFLVPLSEAVRLQVGPVYPGRGVGKPRRLLFWAVISSAFVQDGFQWENRAFESSFITGGCGLFRQSPMAEVYLRIIHLQAKLLSDESADGSHLNTAIKPQHLLPNKQAPNVKPDQM